jgi:hypothetical protein
MMTCHCSSLLAGSTLRRIQPTIASMRCLECLQEAPLLESLVMVRLGWLESVPTAGVLQLLV